jgi:lysophospholipase L1-like esterase
VYYNGDSITVGVGASDNAHRWTTLLSTAKGWTEVNNGLSGYVITPNECRSTWNYTTGGQAIPTKTAEMRFLFISFGVNDAFVNPEITPAAYQAEIEAAIDVAIARGWDPMRCIINSPFFTTFDGNSVNYCDPILSDEARKQLFVSAAQAAALAKGAFFIDVFNHMKNNGGASLTTDAIHPNDAGMAVIADYIDSILPD